jgi:hypothetical protein
MLRRKLPQATCRWSFTLYQVNRTSRRWSHESPPSSGSGETPAASTASPGFIDGVETIAGAALKKVLRPAESFVSAVETEIAAMRTMAMNEAGLSPTENQVPVLSAEELAAREKRRPLCQRATVAFMHDQPDGDLCLVAEEMPRIGLSISGGGWRSMTAATAACDAMSATGILDCVEVVAGLSGGSWFVTQWALGGQERLAFHDTHTRQTHPYLYGQRYLPSIHHYRGLSRMRCEAVVDRAAGTKKLSYRTLGRLAEVTTHSDQTFFYALLFGDGKTMTSRYARFLREHLLIWETPTRRNNLSLAQPSTREAILNGEFPMLVCSVIDTEKGKPNVWCELSPFGARHFQIDNGRSIPMDEMVARLDGEFDPLSAHRIMAICGSAFAVDHYELYSRSPKVIQSISSLFGFKPEIGETILHPEEQGITKVCHYDHHFGSLRDAGHDFNIPVPTMLPKTGGREFDILIVLDAGQGAAGADELAAAVQKGYVEIEGETPASLKAPFPAGTRVRVFYPPKGRGPIIVYVLTLNYPKTSQVIASRNEILTDARYVRSIIEQQLVPTLARAVANFVRRKKGMPMQAAAEARELVPLESIDMNSFRQTMQRALTTVIESGDTSIAANGSLGNPYRLLRHAEEFLFTKLPTDIAPQVMVKFRNLIFESDQPGTFKLNPEDPVDRGLLVTGFCIPVSNDTHLYTYTHVILWNYIWAKQCARELAPEDPALATLLGGFHVNRPLSIPSTGPALDRLKIDDKTHRETWALLANIASEPGGAAIRSKVVELVHTRCREKVVAYGGFSKGSNSPDFWRYDYRQDLRLKLGVTSAVGTLSFMDDAENPDSSRSEEIYTKARDILENDPKFAFLLLESLLRHAQGMKSNKALNRLTPKVASYLKSFDSEVQQRALFAAAFGCSSAVEILKANGLQGSRDEPRTGINVMDACETGNHHAVRSILMHAYEGAPPLQAVKLAVNLNYPKVVHALLTDEEVDEAFISEAKAILAASGKLSAWPEVAQLVQGNV